MYKLIATDLDDTLLTDEKHVSPVDIDTINRLKDTKFVISTGRGFNSVQDTLKEIGLYDKENEYVISYNGAVITENKGNRIIHFDPIGYENARKIFELGLKYDVCIHTYTIDNCYAYRIFEGEKRYLNNRIRITEIDNPDISFLKDEIIIKMLYCTEDMDYLRKIKEEINLDDEFEIAYSAQRYLEFNKKGMNKGYGLETLCNILDIDIKDTIAIGDSTNDAIMIKKAGLGLCVANASEDVIPYCDEILESTNNQSPITEIYNRYLYSKKYHYLEHRSNTLD